MDGRNEAVIDSLTKEIFGKLFEKLLEKDITLVTRAKKNMKNKLMDLQDKLMLRKRAVIESVTNFLVNLVSALAAYSFLPKKPSLHADSNMQRTFYAYLTDFFCRTRVIIHIYRRFSLDIARILTVLYVGIRQVKRNG